jgi:hypothetical protein
MNKFGLLDEDEPLETSLADRILSFPGVRPRALPDLEAIDAAAAQHGFVTREASPTTVTAVIGGDRRRRRSVPSEPTRHLAIRLPSSGYDRFVAYADRKQQTYQDALIALLDAAGE